MKVEVMTKRGHSTREANLRKIGPVATQKADILRRLQRARPEFSKPTLDRWCKWLLQEDPLYNAAHLLMTMNPLFCREDGMGVKLHPYQSKLILCLFLWSLPMDRLTFNRFKDFLKTSPVDYREFDDLTTFWRRLNK